MARYPLSRLMQRAGAICACVFGSAADVASDQVYQFWRVEPLISAELIEPTGRYPHGVLGDTIEYGALRLRYGAGFETTIRLPEHSVFEDIEARQIDIDGDGKLEVMVVESHQDKGARLAIYTGNGLMAATPHIGTRFRWLAPVGTADFDGDGAMDVAYVDRPHLAKTLRVWTYRDGMLTQKATQKGLTNHRIGQDYITSGLRSCGAIAQPEMVTVDAAWQNVIGTRFVNGALKSRIIGPYKGLRSVQNALAC